MVMFKRDLTLFLVCIAFSVFSNLIVCSEDVEDRTHQDSAESHGEGRVIKTEIHEYSSVPKTEAKLEFTSPEVVIHTTNGADNHHKNALIVDFTKEHYSDPHDYHHYNHYNYDDSHNYGHNYEYFYHYRPKPRPLTQAEIEKNRRDRIDVFKDFVSRFLSIGGMNRNRGN